MEKQFKANLFEYDDGAGPYAGSLAGTLIYPHRPSARHAADQQDGYRYLRLGASLYVPGNYRHLEEIANRRKYPELRSVIFCTEDSVRTDDIPFVLKNIENALVKFDYDTDILRFVRVRSPEILSQCLQMNGITNIDGFVLPKVTRRNCDLYMSQFRRDDPFSVMVTLETAEVFDPQEMRALRTMLLDPSNHKRILSLRIGGNDLLNCLGIRRSQECTVYDTPLAHTISMLVSIFKPYGFNLTAPVCDYLEAPSLLMAESRADLSHGLFGKTAIHPNQIAAIESQYRVSSTDLEMAKAIVSADAPAVFRMHDSMCEPATHSNWAAQVLARAQIYGVYDTTVSDCLELN